MTYREVSEAIVPLEKRISELKTLLNATALFCSRGFSPNKYAHAKYNVGNEKDFDIFKQFQNQLRERIDSLEKELQILLDTKVK